MADEHTPTTAYVRDAFISERLRDQGIPIPDDFSLDVLNEQANWHRWLAAHDAEIRRDQAEKDAQIATQGLVHHDSTNLHYEPSPKIAAAIRAQFTPSPTEECSHPESARVMRGWTQVCTACGKGRELG